MNIIMYKKKFLMLLAVFFYAFSVCISAAAQDFSEKDDWLLSLGYGGYSFAGSWVPLKLSLTDPVPDGRLEIIRSSALLNVKSLESYALNHAGNFEFPVFIDESVPVLTVRLFSGAVLLAEQTFHPSDRLFTGHLILVSSIPASVRLSLSRMLYPGEPVLVLPVSPQNLPLSGLDYDAVSCLALSDPGAVLNPSQLDAMGSWLSGGARILLFDARPSPSSLIDQIASRFTLTGSGDRRRLALGSIVTVSSETLSASLMADSGYWRPLLGFKPFERSVRLRPGMVFDKRFEAAPSASAQEPMKSGWAFIVIAWMAFLLLCAFLKKRFFAAVFAVSAIVSVTVLILSPQIASSWNRGVLLQMRELVLPGNSGTLSAMNLSVRDTGDIDVFSKQSTPWVSDFTFVAPSSRDEGRLRFSSPALHAWAHLGNSPGMVLCSTGERTLRFTGFFAHGQDSSGNRAPLAKISRVDNRVKWQIPSSGSTWKDVEFPPGSLASNSPWIAHVSGLVPDLEWLVGIDAPTLYSFGGRSWADTSVLWMRALEFGEERL